MGRGIRKQGAASIFAGGFFRFAVYACVVCAADLCWKISV